MISGILEKLIASALYDYIKKDSLFENKEKLDVLVDKNASDFIKKNYQKFDDLKLMFIPRYFKDEAFCSTLGQFILDESKIVDIVAYANDNNLNGSELQLYHNDLKKIKDKFLFILNNEFINDTVREYPSIQPVFENQILNEQISVIERNINELKKSSHGDEIIKAQIVALLDHEKEQLENQKRIFGAPKKRTIVEIVRLNKELEKFMNDGR